MRRHSSSVETSICKTEITCIKILFVGWKTVHVFCWGSGKSELNMLANSLSEVQCHCRGDPNEREAQSAIRLCFPATCRGARGQHCLIFIRNVRARRSRAPTFDCWDAIRSTQLMEGELSLKRATFSLSNDGWTASITNHINMRPAILRSAIDSRPERLSTETRSRRISSGHLPRKTVGGRLDFSPMITPPNPYPDASVYPTMCSQLLTN